MRSSNARFAVASLLVIALGLWLVTVLYPHFHPLGGVHLPLSAPGVSDKANDFLHGIGLATSDRPRARLFRDNALVRRVYELHGIARGNRLLRDSVAGYSWKLYWKQRGDGSLEPFDAGESAVRAENVVDLKKQAGTVRLQLDPLGKVVSFERVIEDTVRLPGVSAEEARSIALTAVGKAYPALGGVAPSREKRTDLGHRIDYEFAWTVDQPELQNQGEVRALVAGNSLIRISRDYGIPEPQAPLGKEETYRGIIAFVVIVIIGLLMVITGIRRVRAYEISFRSGLLLGIFVGICSAAEMLLQMGSENAWGTYLLVILLVPVFYGGFFVLVWSVAESIGREVMPDKFTVFDFLGRGYFLHSRVGRSLLTGVAGGIWVLVVWMVSLWAMGQLIPGSYIMADESLLTSFSSRSPAFHSLSHSFTGNFYVVAVFMIFLLAFLRTRVPAWTMFLIGAVTFGVAIGPDVQPITANLLFSVILGSLFVFVYLRSDVLASLLALVTFFLAGQGYSLIAAGNDDYLQSGTVVGLVMLVFVLNGLVALLTRDEAVDLEAITPGFVKHITERERLQRELEIARDVQMSMLPKRDPEFPGVEIASRCVPALEVGGDYYDFIALGPGHFGVVVGDVSGKGTQAAFFMTLTKGFLRAVTKVCNSPALVLTQMNSLFCENVERGTFISMVYAIFDMDRRTLTVARAGHNPVISHRSEGNRAELIHPKGIALGLEDGGAFDASIQETEIPFRSGDLFVFYTDGCTEAMNKNQEEFGEERLRNVVAGYSGSSAMEVLESIFAEVRRHAGRATQHDDMTLVVVKVL